jgi:hypothetical protein
MKSPKTVQQQRYTEVCEKLSNGTRLHRGEELWLLGFLQTDEVRGMFFPPQRKRGRHAERDFWMTMDSELSGLPEKEIAKRWKVPGRIGSTFVRWRPEVRRVLEDPRTPDREALKRKVEQMRSLHVKKRERDLQQRARK